MHQTQRLAVRLQDSVFLGATSNPLSKGIRPSGWNMLQKR
jgi:hypothetical protein